MNNTPVTMNASKSATGQAHNNPSIPNNFERTRIDGTKNNICLDKEQMIDFFVFPSDWKKIEHAIWNVLHTASNKYILKHFTENSL